MVFWNNVHREDLLPDGWQKNATSQLGILLNPQGELSLLEYVALAQGDLPEMRERARGTLMQLLVDSMANYVFARNVALSAVMVYRRPRTLAGWCCLIQAIAGLTFSLHALAMTLIPGAGCRHVLWNVGIGLAISPICVSIALLQKAYMVHNRNRWLVIIGIILILPQPIVPYIVWTNPAIVVPVPGCLSYYPMYFPWLKLGLDAPINIVFSVAFLMVVYRQYQQFGTSAWRRLVRNGIQTMCFIVLSNVICMLGAAFEVVGLFSEMFFVIDWAVTSLLLVHHCNTLRPSTSASLAPRTRHVLAGFSQIETAPSAHIHRPVTTAVESRYYPGPRHSVITEVEYEATSTVAMAPRTSRQYIK